MDNASHVIEPGLIYGRPGPVRVQWNLEHLKSKGMAVVVSLVEVDAREIVQPGLKHYFLRFDEKIGKPLQRSVVGNHVGCDISGVV